MSFLDRHAVRTDRYLDALVGADSGARDVPADARLDPEIRHAARALRAAIVRVHPSFRFEERLADRLAAAASRSARIAGDSAVTAGIDPAAAPAAPLFPVAFAVPPAAIRPIVVGGALSLAGAAIVAWRVAHGQPAWPAAALAGLPALPPLPAIPGTRGRTA